MEDQPQKKKSMRKIILPIIIILLIAAIVAGFIKNMDGPAKGSIAYTSSNPTTAKTTIAAPRTYNGQAISFNYPSNFAISSSKKDAGVLDQVLLVGNDHQGKQAAIEVLQESVNNDSGYNYRKSHPNLYKQQRDAFGNIVFVKSQGGSEYTGLIVHGGMVASVSLSTSLDRDLSNDYNAIVKNLQWKQ